MSSDTFKRWEMRFALMLVLVSIIIYIIHFFIFGDLHHILIYGIEDVAFLPFEVLIVTLIIHRLLNEREKKIRLEKLNMVIGAFFSEIGKDLLTYFSDFDPKLDKITSNLIVKSEWTSKEFDRVNLILKDYKYNVDMKKLDLASLKKLLVDKRNFMLRLMENPNLLEHESFTDLLMAVFHLIEELQARKSFKDLPESDIAHIQGDVKRVYVILVHEWLNYMRHLKDNYPYLFSLAMRTNPFDENAQAIVK